MRFQDLQGIELHLTSVCNLSCSFCSRADVFPKPYYIDFQQVKEKVFDKLQTQMKSLILTGSNGEPTLHKDFLTIVQYLVDNNRFCALIVDTNGCTKTTEWWEEFGKLSSKLNYSFIQFAIDGLNDEYCIYRKNGDFDQVMSNMESFIKSGGSATWKYVVFEHNEHQIQESREQAKESGCKNFILVRSRNYDSSYPKPNCVPTVIHKKQVICRALEKKSVVVSFNGEVIPCCFLIHTKLNNNDYKTIHDYIKSKPMLKLYVKYMKDKKYLNLYTSDLETIMNTNYFKYVYENYQNLNRCHESCTSNLSCNRYEIDFLD